MELPSLVDGIMGKDSTCDAPPLSHPSWPRDYFPTSPHPLACRKQLDSTVKIRQLLSTECGLDSILDHIINAGLVPRFVEFITLNTTNPTLQFEAVWALTNVASGTSAHTRSVIDSGAIPPLCALLSDENDDLREQALWCLGNIAGDSPGCRDEVLHTSGAVVAQVVQDSNAFSGKLSVQRTAVWCLSNLCRGKPQPNFAVVRPYLESMPCLFLLCTYPLFKVSLSLL